MARSKRTITRSRRKRNRKISSLLGKSDKSYDKLLVIIPLILSIFGLLMIFEASAVTAAKEFNDRFRFFKNQSLWLVVGLIAMFVSSKIDYRKYYAVSVFLLLSLIVALVGVFLPGIGVKVSGAHRWLNLGLFKFQPTEAAKLILVIYLSAWFTYPEKERFLAFFILLSTILGLIVMEPDLGTAVIIGVIAVVLYFISGAPLWQFALLIPTGLAAVLGLTVASEYRYRRLMTFLNPGSDPLGASYHVRQLLLALGSGGLFGTGIGKSRQKYLYLPEVTTDSIFAIIGEELGFIGTTVVLVLFLVLILRGFRVAKSAPTRFGQLLAAGVSSWLAIQTIINIGANVALLPLTGVPLMFISYGGSSLIITFLALGILLNISKQS